MKLVFVFFILLIFLLIKPAEAMPFWSANYTSVNSSSSYSPKINYTFRINWTVGESYTLSNVLFESNFSTLNETLENITVSSISNNIYQINFTDLPARNFVYRWYAVDNESNWNFTDQLNYSISQNNSVTINLYLNGTENNKSYNLNDMANFTAFLNIPNKTVYLSSNYTDFSTQSGSSAVYNLTNLSSPGFFNLTAYWDGDENYSASNKTYLFDNLPPRYSSISEYPRSGGDYYNTTVYTFSIIWTDATLNQVWFESNHTGTFSNYTSSTTLPVQRISNSYFVLLINLPARAFTYRWIASDSLNKINSTNQNYYNVLQNFPLTIEVTPSKNVIKGTRTVVICRSATSEVTASNFKLFRNSTLIESDTSSTRTDNQTLNAGIYEYICNNTETQNFARQNISVILNVTPNTTSNPPPNVSGTLNLTGPSSVEINLGKYIEKSFYLENDLGQSIDNITFSLTGISSNWYKINDLPTTIPTSFSLLIKINFSIPSDAEIGDYNVSLRAWSRTTNETKIATKTVILSVTTPSPPQNFPPIYLANSMNATSYGNIYNFSLEWNDDNGLSGYIFSSNITGTWANESWTAFSGTEDWSYALENISLQPNTVVAWKVYANDSNNLWTDSEEFYLKMTPAEKADITLPIIIVSVFVVSLAAFIFFIERIRSKSKAPKEQEAIYVYRKEDLK